MRACWLNSSGVALTTRPQARRAPMRIAFSIGKSGVCAHSEPRTVQSCAVHPGNALQSQTYVERPPTTAWVSIECQLAWLDVKIDQEQEFTILFDGREWWHNGVTDFLSYLDSFSCRCECRLGKTLVVRALSVTEFPERR